MISTLCSVDNLLKFERNGTLSIFIEKDDGVTKNTRSIIIDWIFECSTIFKLRKETFPQAVLYLDICLMELSQIPKEKYQLYGLVCLMLAAKKHEIDCPEVSDYVYICNKTYGNFEILDAETEVSNLVFSRDPVDIIQYVRQFTKSLGDCDLDHPTYVVMIYICYLCLLRTNNILPSVVVTASYGVACEITKHIGWNDNINVFRVSQDDITSVRSYIIMNLRNNQNSKLQYIWNRFKTECSKYGVDWEFFINYINNAKISRQKISCIVSKSYKSDIEKFEQEDVKKLKRLGEGTYGKIYKVQYKGVEYAMKKPKLDRDEGIPVTVLREITILLSLNQRNIIKPMYVNSTGTFIMELMDMDLKKYIDKYINKDETTVDLPAFQYRCAKDLLNGLKYMHDNGVTNRDIKPQNILVKGVWPKLMIKYCDFGLGRGKGIAISDVNFTAEICTLWYRPPEILAELCNGNYDPLSVDIWSLMCTLGEVATNYPLFPGSCERETLSFINIHFGIEKYEKTSEGEFNRPYGFITPVLKKGLVLNPEKRANATDLLSVLKDLPKAKYS